MKKQTNSLKLFKIAISIISSISMIIILFVLYVFLTLYVFDIEARDFDLYDQFRQRVAFVEEYKKQQGFYPNQLSDVSSEKICSKKYINFCTTIKYKVIKENSGFRMAARSLSWPIFYYNSDYPETVKYANWAKSSGEPTKEGYFPIYKKTAPIFEHPEEWPML